MTDWLKLENRVRATPLDLLEQGLRRGQWEAVQASYLMLTGKHINLPGGTEASTNVEEEEVKASPPPAKTSMELPEPEDEYVDEEDDFIEDEDDEEEDDEESEDEDDNDTEGVYRRPKNYGASRKIRNKSGGPVNVKGKKNRYEPDETEAAEDLKFAPKAETLLKRRKRHRPAYQKVSVVCKKCGVKEKVDPTLAPKSLDKNYKTKYVCNECSCVGGS